MKHRLACKQAGSPIELRMAILIPAVEYGFSHLDGLLFLRERDPWQVAAVSKTRRSEACLNLPDPENLLS